MCLIYIKNAIKSYKATLIQELIKAGEEDVAKIVKGYKYGYNINFNYKFLRNNFLKVRTILKTAAEVLLNWLYTPVLLL